MTRRSGAFTYPMATRASPLAPAPLLTARQVADLLAISTTTVWRLADRGDLKRVRVGPTERLVRFRADNVEALLDLPAGAGSDGAPP